MPVTLGLVLLVQGGGGLINNLFADSKSWFLLNHLELPAAVRLAGHAVLLVIGLLLLARRDGWARLLP
ncbi:hypothetical protein FHX41_0693 [Actinomadura hallensis]|uniref:Uncharacterized protein n=1 Tax=Actinomadura hallensis TaxID=337895 RepID=A0A543I934_9ACTN|nr:hypothetical protein [Actinomadura hallensis]TQM67095.1 hypothetical protein FHX41_0693 [Actinomadura hallensis]